MVNLNRQRGQAPRVSVIMATYNGASFIRQSVVSLLAQTLRDFELIIVDDCSTDGTVEILKGILDSRIRIIRNAENVGVVRSRNRCFDEVRGTYVAMLDHDDISRPTRLEKQVVYLDNHPGTVLLGTAAHIFNNGRLIRTKHPRWTNPILIRWLLHVANPIVCSSVMFCASAISCLGTFMREDYEYADDYDLYHRLKELGDIARLDEPLTIYRLHSENAFRRHEEIMTANAVKVLVPAYDAWFGSEAERAALLVVNHLSAGKPVLKAETLTTLQRYFEHLNRSFVAKYDVDDVDRKALQAHADELWQRMLRATARNGITPSWRTRPPSSSFKSSAGDYAHFVLGRLPLQVSPNRLRALLQRRTAPAISLQSQRLFDTPFEPIKPDLSGPPTLFMVVDTEAEFDWTQPFAHYLTGVTAMENVDLGQAIFDQYGLRPIYVVDFPVASQESSVSRLRRILDRGSCYIGAHLHPWTTPPFEEQLSSRNSFPGNLPPELEEQKLACLVQTIRSNLGVSPPFYKAGRYGLGRATAGMLGRHGIKVDLSVLPGADLRRAGGPDFRKLQTTPYWIAGDDILTVPMTRGHVGFVPSLGWGNETARQIPGLKWARIPSILSRLRIVDTITLTPEGITASEQIRLIKSMIKRGSRLFVMHYHSPSLSPGHTPYVRSKEDVDRFLENIREVLRYFFEDVGGLPGYPPDLLYTADQRASPSS